MLTIRFKIAKTDVVTPCHFTSRFVFHTYVDKDKDRCLYLCSRHS